jgi:hypothetical protein
MSEKKLMKVFSVAIVCAVALWFHDMDSLAGNLIELVDV